MEKYHVTDGAYNYYTADSREEALAKAKELQEHDVELKDFYMKKCGYIPDNVDIHPEGYSVSTNRFN